MESQMNLYQAARHLQEAQEQYLRWREVRQELAEWPVDEPLAGWLFEDCRTLDPSLSSTDLFTVARQVTALESPIKTQLREARVASWYEQGKMLRYALVLLQNRLDSVQADLIDEGNDAALKQTLALLQMQMDSLRMNIAQWERREDTATVVCSLEEIRRLVADPRHDADKEHLERIIDRAQAARLPESLVCIRLQWHTVSGEVLEAAVLPDAPNQHDASDQEEAKAA